MSIGTAIILVICLIVFCGSGAYLANYFYKAWSAQKAIPVADGSSGDLLTDKGTIIGKYAGLYQKNPDLIGWVKIEGTKIDYPVMQTRNDPEFYQKHPTFQFDTIYKGGQGTYQIIAACYSKIYDQEDDVFKYYQYAGITDEEQFNEYVAGVKAISGYDTGVTAEYGDQLVTLSTCAYQTEEGRFFIVGKRIDAKQQKPQF